MWHKCVVGCYSRTTRNVPSIHCTKKAGLYMLCIVCGAKVQHVSTIHCTTDDAVE